MCGTIGSGPVLRNKNSIQIGTDILEEKYMAAENTDQINVLQLQKRLYQIDRDCSRGQNPQLSSGALQRQLRYNPMSVDLKRVSTGFHESCSSF